MMDAFKVDFDYDKSADVMYLSIDSSTTPSLCVADDQYESINYRFTFDSHKLIGVTIWSYSQWDRTMLRHILEKETHLRWPRLH